MKCLIPLSMITALGHCVPGFCAHICLGNLIGMPILSREWSSITLALLTL